MRKQHRVPRTTLVNGARAQAVPAADRGLAYGDGVFRTFPARDGRPLHWGRHVERLGRDCARLALAVPPPDLLAQEIGTACADIPDATVKVTVTRGSGERGYRYDPSVPPTRIVSAGARSAYPAHYSEAGVRVRVCNLRLSHQPALAGAKHLNRLENVLARAEWHDESIAEGLLLDVEGWAIGGTMTNLFISRAGNLATPALDCCGVAGVTRDRVIDAAAGAGILCTIERLGLDDVLQADEVFLVNSLAGVWPVRELAASPRAPGAITRQIQALLLEAGDG